MKNKTPHLDKINAALSNPLSNGDKAVLEEIKKEYKEWIKRIENLKSSGEEKVKQMVVLLNQYKDLVEVELILGKGSSFLTRQKGQLKLDNSILEEFLIMLMDTSIIPELAGVDFVTGPQKAFMSMSFRPTSFKALDKKPEFILKVKDQDFTIGKELFYKLSAEADFTDKKTETGSFTLAVVAAECKVNYDKTMFQECSGTASRLKQGIPNAKYFALVEFLDMEPEDCRLTDIDNVFLLRHAKRLPFGKRNDYKIVKEYRKKHPIDGEIIWMFVLEIKNFLGANWYDPKEALKRGSFI